MSEEHLIVQRVYDAKGNMQVADSLIADYLPFIKAQVVKLIKRPLNIQHDEEFSIAMIAFHEAINGYSRARGSFLNYAAMLIRSRIIDFWRKNSRHGQVISLTDPGKTEGSTIEDHLADDKNHQEEMVLRQATKEEIAELTQQMESFGISLTDIADASPKQARTLKVCQKVVAHVKNDSELMNELLRTKRLPLKKLISRTQASKKTVERHRKYIIALLLIYSNGYEIIRGHLTEVMKGVAAK